ncbi:hypothetical protein AVEN_18948-1, partial [Araneus ventricosus]
MGIDTYVSSPSGFNVPSDDGQDCCGDIDADGGRVVVRR